MFYYFFSVFLKCIYSGFELNSVVRKAAKKKKKKKKKSGRGGVGGLLPTPQGFGGKLKMLRGKKQQKKKKKKKILWVGAQLSASSQSIRI